MKTVKRILESKGRLNIPFYEKVTEYIDINFPDNVWEDLVLVLNLEKLKHTRRADLRTVIPQGMLNMLTDNDFTIVKLALLTNLYERGRIQNFTSTVNYLVN